MDHRQCWDRKTVLYAIALCALVLTFTLHYALPGHMDPRTEYSEIASNVWARIVLTSLFTMSFLSAPPNFVFYGIAVLGIVQYNNRRIRRKIERSYVPTPDPRCQRLLDDVAREAGVKDVELLVLDSSFPNAFTLNRGPKYYVAITVSMLEILETEELRSVFAHEIAHIKNKDSRIKILGLVVRSQYFYQPLVYLIVKAIFRRREYLADETAATLERTSLPLMSALLKIAQYLRSFSGSEDIPFPATSFAFAQRPSTGLRRILSSAPTIEDRIRNLIKLPT
jgi:Zn-dependent protease with chaperone function